MLYLILYILLLLIAIEFDPTSLDARKQHAIALLPPPHLLPPQENELFSSWDEAKTRLQDYAFTQGFALVTETHDKKNHLIVLDCTRHHKRVRNTRKVEEEDRVRANTKLSFNECPYHLREDSGQSPHRPPSENHCKLGLATSHLPILNMCTSTISPQASSS